MWAHSLILSMLLAFGSNFCHANGKKVEVVGIAECADCKDTKIKLTQAFSGLHVTIDCRIKNGEMKRRGKGKLDKEGKFKVLLPEGILQQGKLKEECYVQLHSAIATPCPTQYGIEESKIVVLKSMPDGKCRLKPKGNLKFSTSFCTSDTFWPFFKPPPFPLIHPWKKNFPPWKSFGHPWVLPPFPPLSWTPFPPIFMPIQSPQPISEPKPPAYLKLPPSIPIYKPKPPLVIKPLLPPIPIYKPPLKLLPPLVSIFKPPIKLLPPFVPIYKPPVQPLPPHVPIYKPPVQPLPIYKPPVQPLPPQVPIFEPSAQPLPPPVSIYKPIPPVYKKLYPPFP